MRSADPSIPGPLARLWTVATLIATLGCAGATPEGLGLHAAHLAPCPESPNCVSSDAVDAEHEIGPLLFSGDAAEAWRRARAAVTALPRTEIVEATDDYLRAQSTSAVFRFVDDLELQLRPDAGTIALRSASRLGYSDMGANRARVEALRARFDETVD